MYAILSLNVLFFLVCSFDEDFTVRLRQVAMVAAMACLFGPSLWGSLRARQWLCFATLTGGILWVQGWLAVAGWNLFVDKSLAVYVVGAAMIILWVGWMNAMALWESVDQELDKQAAAKRRNRHGPGPHRPV